MIKILFSICRYEINGVSRAINNLIENLDIDKFSMSLLVQTLDKNHYPFTKKINISHLDVKPAAGLIGKIKNIFNIISNYRRIIKAEDPKIIVSFGYTSNCYILLASLFSRRRKIVISERSEKFYIRNGHLTPKERLFSAAYRLSILALYRKADSIVAVSDNIADIMKKRFFINRSKIRVIPNGIDIEKVFYLSRQEADGFEFNNKKRYIGVISRLSFEKGLSFLIKSLKSINEKIDTDLILIGDGEGKNNLSKLTDELNLKEKVHFLGYKENPYSYLKKLDVFILPSYYEGFSNVILEAMACKVPVVASDIGSNREIINDGVDGFLINTKNPEELANRVLDLFRDNGLRREIVANAERKVQGFSLKDNVRQYESILENVKP